MWHTTKPETRFSRPRSGGPALRAFLRVKEVRKLVLFGAGAPHRGHHGALELLRVRAVAGHKTHTIPDGGQTVLVLKIRDRARAKTRPYWNTGGNNGYIYKLPDKTSQWDWQIGAAPDHKQTTPPWNRVEHCLNTSAESCEPGGAKSAIECVSSP